MAALIASSSAVALSSRSALVAQSVPQRPFAAARVTARPMVQVVAAKPTRAQEWRGMSNEDIDAAVQQCKKDMFSMRIKFAKREEWKPSDYKALKRKVAQLLTVRRERELAQGIDRRASKSAENRRLVEAGLGKFAS